MEPNSDRSIVRCDQLTRAQLNAACDVQARYYLVEHRVGLTVRQARATLDRSGHSFELARDGKLRWYPASDFRPRGRYVWNDERGRWKEDLP